MGAGLPDEAPVLGNAKLVLIDDPTLARLTMLTRWDPFRELARVQEEMNRVYGDERQLFRAGESVGWTPACDIYEDGEEIVVRAELAGVEPKDVDVRFENSVLTLARMGTLWAQFGGFRTRSSIIQARRPGRG